MVAALVERQALKREDVGELRAMFDALWEERGAGRREHAAGDAAAPDSAGVPAHRRGAAAGAGSSAGGWSRAAGYYLWLLVLLRAVPALRGDPPGADGGGISHSAAQTGGAPVQTALSPGGAELVPAAPRPQLGRRRTERTGPPLPRRDRQGRLLRTLLTAPALWTAVWGLGAAVCLGRCVRGYLRFSRAVRRTAEPPCPAARALLRRLDPAGRAALAESPHVPAPMLLGCCGPSSCSRRGWTTPRGWEDILRHELVHARRHDLLYKWLTAAVTSLHWFNPLMYLVRRRWPAAVSSPVTRRCSAPWTRGTAALRGDPPSPRPRRPRRGWGCWPSPRARRRHI
ncbi:MAG: M56 family metallopeptidase [Intestinimonas sp.]